jgi:hypothetical protein
VTFKGPGNRPFDFVKMRTRFVGLPCGKEMTGSKWPDEIRPKFCAGRRNRIRDGRFGGNPQGDKSLVESTLRD